jgi:carboxymethylenebutenolidase
VAREDITIDTADGACPTSVFTPSDGTGPWPGVIFFMDGLGIRPALHAMAQRLADAGYVVLLPDLFYRVGTYGPLVPAEVFASEEARTKLAPLMQATDPGRAGEDTAFFLDHLAAHPSVTGSKVGTTGYCMGGAISLTAAGRYPDRVAAAASFHGGRLANDSELSPHLLADQIQARVYIGAADNDRSYPPEMAAQLVQALMAAGVDHRHELYAGAAHGWTMEDFPIYDRAAAERHWSSLLELFGETLSPAG